MTCAGGSFSLTSHDGIRARVQANTLRSRCSLAAAAALPLIGTTFGGRISTSSNRFRKNSCPTSGGTVRSHALTILSCKANSMVSRGKSAAVVGGNARSAITRTHSCHALPGDWHSDRQIVTRYKPNSVSARTYHQTVNKLQHIPRMGFADGPAVELPPARVLPGRPSHEVAP